MARVTVLNSEGVKTVDNIYSIQFGTIGQLRSSDKLQMTGNQLIHRCSLMNSQEN